MEITQSDIPGGDPDDWPTDWRELRDIDSSLRCSICCEFMKTPMILSKCSHSYCSICIRRSISYKTQCPTCFVSATDGDMVNNRILDEVIQKFSCVRQKLLEIISANNNTIKQQSSSPPSKPQIATQSFKPLLNKIEENHSPATKLGSFFGKGKKSVSKSSHSVTKSTENEKKPTERKNPTRRLSNKRYIQSEDSDTVDDDSDSDVICYGEEEEVDVESSDEDFSPTSPVFKRVRGKQKSSIATPAKTSDSLNIKTKNDTSQNGGSNTPAKVSVASPGACASPFTQSPLRLPSLNMKSSAPSSPQPEVPSCSSAGSGSAEKSGRSLVRVPCPVCGVEVSDKHINLHLDRCLTNKGRTETRPAPKRKQMPKLVYNLLSDKELKKKCNEAGLSNQGDRQTLIKRHHEFTLLYNAQCDAANPMSVREVIKEVERTEQARSKGLKMKGASMNKLIIKKGSDADQVELAQKEYAKQHKSQFADLIAEARSRRLKKQAEKAQQAAAASVTPDLTEESRTSEHVNPAPDEVQDDKSATSDVHGDNGGNEKRENSNGSRNSSGDQQLTVPRGSRETQQAAIRSRNGEDVICVDDADFSHSTLAEQTIPHISSLREARLSSSPPKKLSKLTERREHVSPSSSEQRNEVPPAGIDQRESVDDMETQFLGEDDIPDEMLSQQPDFTESDLSDNESTKYGATEHGAAKHKAAGESSHHVVTDDEAAYGDDTLPLEDSQVGASDDDLFNSPGSPSLLVDAMQSYEHESQMSTGRLPQSSVSRVNSDPAMPSDTNNEHQESTPPSTHTSEDGTRSYRASSDMAFNSELQDKDEDLSEASRKGKRKKNRVKKDCKVTSTQGASKKTDAEDVPHFNLGFPDYLDSGDAPPVEDAISETLSEAPSSLSSLSHPSTCHGDSDIQSGEFDNMLAQDIPKPRRSGRARNKRRLSGASEQVAPPMGKRTRRCEDQNEAVNENEAGAEEMGRRQRKGRKKEGAKKD